MFNFEKKFEPNDLEEKVIEFWKKNQVFEKSLTLRQAQGKKSKTFVFYEGPPYANGQPGIHHVLARVFKDIILRYKTMRGFSVPRRAGWDTHGLPIELATEKALGIKSKTEIEKVGISVFNAKARELIFQYKGEWEKLTERIGYWLDFKNAYITYENNFIESLWWIFKTVADRGYLKRSYKVVPYCARCATPLASHELAQPGVYKKTKDPSLFVKFEIRNPKSEKKKSFDLAQDKSKEIKEFLLIWTTTPWTLPANVAVAVNPKLTYTKFKVVYGDGREEYLWSYNSPPNIEGVEVEAVEKISGKKLVGLEYVPLYKTWKTKSSVAFRVAAGDFVETEEGTGLVHIAPSFGEDDFRLIESLDKKLIEEMPETVDGRGFVVGKLPGSGKFVKEADGDVIADLKERGFLYHEAQHEHEYPFCWRCGNPLIYFARHSWFFEVSRIRRELESLNQKINWIPHHLKDGRFGEWLKEAKDWAISRERYWGTPLPIWQCEKCDYRFIAGSLEDLAKNSYPRNKFWIARHPESEHNVTNWLATGKEVRGTKISKPTEAGLKSVEKLAKKLKKEKIDIIYASPFFRAKKMAEIIGKVVGAKVILDNRLGEVNCGVLNGGPIELYREFFKTPIERFSRAPEGGETLTEVRARVMSFISEINKVYEGKNILVISHGDPLWMLEAGINNLSDEEAIVSAKNYLNLGEARTINIPSLPYNEAGQIDIHRPYIDSVHLKCEKCSSRMTRVEDVADVWFDSGSMPFASLHYPFENKHMIDAVGAEPAEAFPADYICEGLDQTRGWFYLLLAVSALLDKGVPYKNVLTMGLVLDKHGQKMSKSKGNVVDPWAIIQKHGADAVRWYFYTINPPSEPKRFDEADVVKTMRKFLLTLYNSYVFLKTYGIADCRLQIVDLQLLDRWILARLHKTIGLVTENLEKYEIGDAACDIEVLVDDLSRWYIRRSRRRFQKPESEKDLETASSVLRYVLLEVSRLIAPFVPFFGEALYLNLTTDYRLQTTAFNSVHLEDWPEIEKKYINESLILEMAETRRLSSDALALRAALGIKVRQPLAKLKIKSLKFKVKELLDILKDEVNVKNVVLDSSIKDDIEFDRNITPELKTEGLQRELVRMVQDLRQTANYEPKDEIILSISMGAGLRSALGDLKVVLKEVGAKKIEESRSEKSDAQIETKIDGGDVWLGIRKK